MRRGETAWRDSQLQHACHRGSRARARGDTSTPPPRPQHHLCSPTFAPGKPEPFFVQAHLLSDLAEGHPTSIFEMGGGEMDLHETSQFTALGYWIDWYPGSLVGLGQLAQLSGSQEDYVS